MSDFRAFIASSDTSMEDMKEGPKTKTAEPGEPVEPERAEVMEFELI